MGPREKVGIPWHTYLVLLLAGGVFYELYSFNIELVMAGFCLIVIAAIALSARVRELENRLIRKERQEGAVFGIGGN